MASYRWFSEWPYVVEVADYDKDGEIARYIVGVVIACNLRHAHEEAIRRFGEAVEVFPPIPWEKVSEEDHLEALGAEWQIMPAGWELDLGSHFFTRRAKIVV